MQQAQDPNEVFDVVDGTDQVIGQATRAEVHRRHLLHRAVHILMFDAENRVYLQKRSLLKDTCPGLYTTSCAGHVDAGEDYAAAARRELREELGIALPAEKIPDFLFKSGPCADTGWEFIHVYRLDWPGVITPNPVEIAGEWRGTATELDTFIARNPASFSASFRHLWKIFRNRQQSRE